MLERISTTKILLICIAFFALTIVAYGYFLSTTSFTVVKGISTHADKPILEQNNVYFVPLPPKAIEIGADTSENSRSRTIETALTFEEITNFYKNFFAIQNWVLVDESSKPAFYTFEFRLGDKTVKLAVSNSAEEDLTTSGVDSPILVNIQEFF